MAEKTDQEKLLDQIKGLIADSQKESVKVADLEKMVADINTEIAKKLDDDGIKALKDSVDKLIADSAKIAADVNAIKETPAKKADDKPMTFKEALMAAIMEKKDRVVKEINDANGKRLSIRDYFEVSKTRQENFVIKTEMLESSIVQSNVATVRLTELDAQRVGIPLTIYPHVVDWMPSKPISRPTMSVLVVYSYSDGAGTKTEGAASTISSFLLKTVEFKSFFIATFFTLSDETLDDLDEAMSEIAVTAPSKILDNVDDQVLGTAGDDSSALAGLFTSTKKTDFASGTTYLASTLNANMVDVVAKMKLQCKKNKYLPDTCTMNASDIEKLAAEKDQLDNSKYDRRLVYNMLGEPVAICGMRLVLSEAVTADTLAVLDSKQLMIGKRKDMIMEIGYNGSDLTEGQKTVVIKTRLAFAVRDKAAVIYCSGWDAAVTAINIA